MKVKVKGDVDCCFPSHSLDFDDNFESLAFVAVVELSDDNNLVWDYNLL